MSQRGCRAPPVRHRSLSEASAYVVTHLVFLSTYESKDDQLNLSYSSYSKMTMENAHHRIIAVFV